MCLGSSTFIVSWLRWAFPISVYISEESIIRSVCSRLYHGHRLEYVDTERDFTPDGRLVATVVCFSVPDLHFAFWVRFTPNGWVSSGSSCSAF